MNATKETYKIMVDDDERLVFRADFAQASCPIEIEGGDGWTSTPFQVADATHRPYKAAELLIGWCESEGGPCVVEDEEYEIVSVD